MLQFFQRDGSRSIDAWRAIVAHEMFGQLVDELVELRLFYLCDRDKCHTPKGLKPKPAVCESLSRLAGEVRLGDRQGLSLGARLLVVSGMRELRRKAPPSGWGAT